MDKYQKNELKIKNLHDKLLKNEYKNCFIKIKIDKHGLIVDCKKETQELLEINNKN